MQVAAVLLPTLALASLFRLDQRATFALRAPRWGALLPVLVGAVATLLLVVAFQTNVMPRPAPKPDDEVAGFEQLMGKLLGLPRWQLYLLVAVIPPICEELLFRGFLFSALRARFGDLWTVLLTAFLFGLLHLEPQRIPATALAGVALGYVRLRTGSIAAPIFFHVAYNAMLFDLSTGGILFDAAAWCGVGADQMRRLLDRPPAVAVVAAAAALVGAAYWLKLVQPPSETGEPGDAR
jgi:sodium transport system permease protein